MIRRVDACSDETKPFRFIQGDPMEHARSRGRDRQPARGSRATASSEILDAALEVLAEVGYDRLTMDAVADPGQGLQGHALPPLERQGRAWSSTRCCAPRRRPPAARTPAPCAATCSQTFCGIGGLTDQQRRRHASPACSPRSAATPSSPRRSARASSAPRSQLSRADLRAGPRPRRDRAPTSTSTCSPRRSPGSSCTASSCSGEPADETTHRPRHRPDHPARRDRRPRGRRSTRQTDQKPT